jgi:hypothetical protein
MKYIFIVITLFFLSCSKVHYNSLSFADDVNKIERLKQELIAIGANKQEAQELATLAVVHSKTLANSYNLASPPQYHNFLVNSGQRERGLCYHFVQDLDKEIQSRHFKSFRFKWGVANQNKLNEHNVIVVLGKNTKWEDGIILDAWRNSGELFFTKVKDDKEYKFKEWKEGSLTL